MTPDAAVIAQRGHSSCRTPVRLKPRSHCGSSSWIAVSAAPTRNDGFERHAGNYSRRRIQPRSVIANEVRRSSAAGGSPGVVCFRHHPRVDSGRRDAASRQAGLPRRPWLLAMTNSSGTPATTRAAASSPDPSSRTKLVFSRERSVAGGDPMLRIGRQRRHLSVQRQGALMPVYPSFITSNAGSPQAATSCNSSSTWVPYFSSLAAPMPWMPCRSALVRGARSAIATRVASWKIT